jgi:hypothetical protein
VHSWRQILQNVLKTRKEIKMTTSSNILECKSFIRNFILNRNINELVEAIDELLNNNSSEILTLINQSLSEPDTLSLLIKRIIDSPLMFAKTLDQSYYHENGFHKIVLLSGKQFKLRLHHFGVSSKIPMENIHDHRWAFASTILSGTLEMDMFEQSQYVIDENKLIHYVYNSDKSTGSYSTDKIGMVSLNKIETRFYEVGETYLMLPDELHRIKNQEGQESLTLILTGKPENNTCNLYALREIEDEEKNTVKYEALYLKKMLEENIEKIFPQKN